jgi:hypothetical protein
MLYEPPKTKRYIIIGAIAFVLAVLAIVAIPSFFKDKTIQTPLTDPLSQEKIKQQKIQKDMQAAAEKLKDASILEQQTKEDMNSASSEVKKLPTPSQEDMQKAVEKLNQIAK